MEWNADPQHADPQHTGDVELVPPTDADERPVDDVDDAEPGPIERPIETPEADLIDQLRDVPVDDDDHDR